MEHAIIEAAIMGQAYTSVSFYGVSMFVQVRGLWVQL